jgi:hypothetical protein
MPSTPDSLKQYSEEAMNNLEYIVSKGAQLSTESASIPLVDTLKSSFQDYLTTLTTFINGLKVTNYRKQFIDAKEVVERLRTFDFSKSRLLEVTVPAGFNGKWIPFLELLIKDILPPVTTADTTLRLINTKLAQALTEPTRLKAQSGIRNLTGTIALVDGEDFEKMKKVFASHSKTSATLSSVVDRNADVDRAYQLINHLNADLAAVDFSGIQKLLERLGELTKALKATLETEEHTEMSGLVTSQLSDLFYKVGITITAGAVLMDLTEQLSESMLNTRDQLLTQIPKTEA